ncbi:MAG: glutamine-hydrolyzing carbamoyl-phosphate synthase small subunit [Bacteroidetes bacterium]|nr:glutamine-hydrolyzing carbamoyl-phosphate synthase small subunit [Bacteroidota bacterium]
MNPTRPKAKLALENGIVFTGRAFGAVQSETSGEVVFNTSITGYQEILTDPSYYGQIVTMTYPHQGNVGTNHFDVESTKVHAAGFVTREASRIPSNWRCEKSLDDYLRESGVIGIEGIDTRMLVRILREEGAMRGVISAQELDDATLVERARSIPQMTGLDLTSYVTCKEPYTWTARDTSGYLLRPVSSFEERGVFHVVVMDFGVKHNILERLASYGCRLTVVPAGTGAHAIMAMEPDGIFLSNGPGDPDAVKYAIETIRELIGRKPIFGICLGHQLLALALGATTYKLKFGHRGANHPVQNLSTATNEITSQNHGFAVDAESLKSLPVDITHINLNDGTVEGFRHRELPLFCVQYHPEAGPGPHDADYLFKQFVEMMARENVAVKA